MLPLLKRASKTLALFISLFDNLNNLLALLSNLEKGLLGIRRSCEDVRPIKLRRQNAIIIC